MDPITATTVTMLVVGGTREVIKKIDCKLSVSSGVSLITGTPDVTLGLDCSKKKNKE